MFKNRQEAGEKLAEKLLQISSEELLKDFIVLAVPRGGVVAGSQIAKKLGCPLDIIVTRKIGAPGEKELAIGAVGETSGSAYLNKKIIGELYISDEYLQEEILLQKKEIKRREKLYRKDKPALSLEGKVVILADDGAATGATLIAAAREVWNNNPKKVIIVLPVAPPNTVGKLEKEVDEVVVLQTPKPFFSVGQFYEEFEQVSDEEVIKNLANSANKPNLANS